MSRKPRRVIREMAIAGVFKYRRYDIGSSHTKDERLLEDNDHFRLMENGRPRLLEDNRG